MDTKTLNRTGINSKYCKKNIFDLSGNYEESTMEKYAGNDGAITRGNSAYTLKKDASGSSRNKISNNLSIRFILKLAGISNKINHKS